MDAGLRQDFGFRHILWVYSGRRGVHCWVADDVARALTNEGRSAVADYFSVVAGNDNQSKKVGEPLRILSISCSPRIIHRAARFCRFVLSYAW